MVQSRGENSGSSANLCSSGLGKNKHRLKLLGESMKTLTFFAFLFVALIATSSSVGAQVRVNPPLVAGKTANIRLATTAEKTRAMELVASSPVANFDNSSDMTGQPPVFAIQITGDVYNSGITANAFSVNTLPAGTLYYGVQIAPNGEEHVLSAWYSEEEVPAGYLYYNLDNGKKPNYSEPGGVLGYKIVSVTGNVVRQYTAKRNFGIVGTVPRQMITRASAGYSGSLPRFYIFGNFGSIAGVLLQLPDSYTWSVPAESVRMRNGFIELDFSNLKDVYLPPGDYKMTVVSAGGYSDNGMGVRLLDRTQNNISEEGAKP